MDLIEQVDHWGQLHPEHAAHMSGGSILTYGQLRLLSDRFANHLSSTITDRRTAVIILGHKQNEMLIGFLGWIKAGHPYVPLDSSLPAQRIDTIKETAHAELFTADQVKEIVMQEKRESRVARHVLRPEDPWYIIFTSGSTGNPKGVTITRTCLEDFIQWIFDEQGFIERG